ncbi:hypothetical protein V6N13_124862 [Hibiscus sabdariffa]|uniref:non-specific serine/threonine protein kinase n=1 Tax=Hibiscus sabdariffa TaxID=183260 RepID=A0ABR2U498_9ROSI
MAGGKDYFNNYQTSPWVSSGKVPEHAVYVPSPSGGGSGVGPPIYSSEASSQFSGPHRPPLPPPSPNLALGFNKTTFTYEELLAATNGFSQANLIGQGGFGFVHKGVLPNGKEVEVRSLKSGSGQGERVFTIGILCHLLDTALLVGSGCWCMILFRTKPRNIISMVNYSLPISCWYLHKETLKLEALHHWPSLPDHKGKDQHSNCSNHD